MSSDKRFDGDMRYTGSARSRRSSLVMVRRYLASAFLALCVIGVGVGYLGNYVSFLPWENFTIFFPGWGALFLILPALYFLICGPFSWFWVLLGAIGGWIVVAKWHLVDKHAYVGIVLCVLVILFGLRLLLRPLFRKAFRRSKLRRKTEYAGEQGSIYEGGDGVTSFSVKFGTRTVDMSGRTFDSATASVFFGELVLDLRRATVQDCAVIDADCSFGELQILLPEEVRVELSSHSSFAHTDNSHRAPADVHAPVVYINADCSFGEIEIR